METKLFRTFPARRRFAASLGVLATAGAVAIVGPGLVQADSIQPVTTGGTSTTGGTGVTADPNDYTCTGHIAHGSVEQGVPGTEVRYWFSCDGPITSYQIETEPHQIEYADASPVVQIGTATAVGAADGFECQGIFPGVAIDCTSPSGLVGTSYAGEQITGQFTIAGSLGTEPRLDPILTVTDATATGTATAAATPVKVTTAQTESSTGASGSTTVTSKVTVSPVTTTVVDAMSGPFDLGRPTDAGHDAFDGDTRLGNHPPTVVLTSRNKKTHVYTTTKVPVDGTTGSTGIK
jgi:hypothetical protein